MLTVLLISITSCGKRNYSNDDIYNSNSNEKHYPTRNRVARVDDTKVKDGDKDDWSKLDIKLGQEDNKGLYKEIKEWLGTPYKYAGNDKGIGADCSGFVMMVFLKVYGKPIERNSARIFNKNCREIKRNELREGDLVFFYSTKSKGINHVGIYLKEGYFAHASSSKGVIITSLYQPYYDTHFLCAGRVR